tara:strand:- start:399 stop:764 length:366 start_codon:yes stop_codon:yes gene_type:complete
MLKIEIDKSKFCDTKSIAKEISSFGGGASCGVSSRMDHDRTFFVKSANELSEDEVTKVKESLAKHTHDEDPKKSETEAMLKIQELESAITSRRFRDALASDDGKKWIADQEKLIAVERAKL